MGKASREKMTGLTEEGRATNPANLKHEDILKAEKLLRRKRPVVVPPEMLMEAKAAEEATGP